MPATYHVIPGNVWGRTFRRLSMEAKLTAFAVYTSPLRISEGLFELAAGHLAADTGLTVEEVEEALDELQQADVLRYDHDAELVLIPWALKASPLKHSRDEATGEIATRDDGSQKLDKRIAPAVRKLRSLPASPLKAVFLDLARQYSPDLAEALEGGPPKGATEGARQGATKGASREESESEAEKSKSASHEKEPSPVGRANGKEDHCSTCGDPISGWCPKIACGKPALRVAGGAS